MAMINIRINHGHHTNHIKIMVKNQRKSPLQPRNPRFSFQKILKVVNIPSGFPFCP